MLTFNTDGMVIQRFPFPKPIMDYILENFQPQHLIKLYPTCKFFYDQFRKNIIQHLEVVPDGEDEIFDPVKTIIRASNPALSQLADFWITDSFTNRVPSYLLTLPDFSHCIIKKLELTKCLYWKDYEILTRAGTVEELNITEPILIPITDIASFVASFDVVISQVPNAKSIQIFNGHFAVTTCASLISLNHKTKISTIILRSMKGMSTFDLEKFIDFLYQNASDNCNIHVDFDSTGLHFVENLYAHDFTEEIEAALETKKNSDV